MIMSLREQICQVTAAQHALSESLKPFAHCPSGLGCYRGGLWTPYAAADYSYLCEPQDPAFGAGGPYPEHRDAEWCDNSGGCGDFSCWSPEEHSVEPEAEFIVGAASHENTGVRKLSRVVEVPVPMVQERIVHHNIADADSSPALLSHRSSGISSCCAAESTHVTTEAVSHGALVDSWSLVNERNEWLAGYATRIQATWRGWALRTFAVDLRGAWPRLRAVYVVLARGNVVMDIATGMFRARKADDPVRPPV